MVDFIWTQGYPKPGYSNFTCCLAIKSGWLYGIRSTEEPCYGTQTPSHKVSFVDCDYKNYQHYPHRRIVELYKPKYATAQDIERPGQFDIVMEQAEELSKHAENIIIIPKIDCIHEIPSQYMLGYSVHTRYGGTTVPIERFAGRRVHLLGGSTKKQLEVYKQLKEEVVSLDNNELHLIAKYGDYIDGRGKRKNLRKTGFGHLTNPLFVALSMSFGAYAGLFNQAS